MGRAPTLHLVNQQWTQAGYAIALTSGQALATAMLNTVLMLTYENVGPNANTETRTSRRPNSKSKGSERESKYKPTKNVQPYYTFHWFYGHDISKNQDVI